MIRSIVGAAPMVCKVENTRCPVSAAVMEPLIIVIMACVVVPIVLAIMMPMYSLYDSIG